MKRKLTFLIILLIIIIIGISFYTFNINSKTDLKTVKSQSNFKKLYDGESSEILEYIVGLSTMPWSFLADFDFDVDYSYGNSSNFYTDSITTSSSGINPGSMKVPNTTINSSSSGLSTIFESANSFTSTETTSSKDYSTTNIQVENVDEADITKTDGNYIYSISDNNVIITNVENPKEIKIASKINTLTGTPQDLILYNNKLVIISADTATSSWKNNTIVEIYNIDNKENPFKVKNYKLFEPYYTSRCIGNKLYVISSGRLRKEGKDIVAYYTENNKQINLDLNNMYYLKNVDTNVQTLISTVDLDNPYQNVSVQSYLIDISNAYVSENNIYLLNQEYNYRYSTDVPPISSLFTFKGAIGPFVYEEDDDVSYSNRTTYIYKFNIENNGLVKYNTKTKVDGQTINQFSIDEYDGNLRVALYDNNGSKVVIFNKKLEKISETPYLAPGEKMYSSRFMGNKAYLVTYRTVDPLYVIDLSDPTNPTPLGELKIPGYSTYLHPYDENHLIGIGMETKETVRRDNFGKVISTSASIVGMKMALFDVSDVNNPKQLSSTVIGDSRTTSSILTNHKALLFSKEKQLIAIPVNNYEEDFEITNSSDSYSSIINSYKNYSKSYISEGYLVYNINLEEGFKLKGDITHNLEKTTYGYRVNSNLLRGLYINDNLFTISEDAIKVNNLDNLELINELNIRTGSNSLINSSTTEVFNTER